MKPILPVLMGLILVAGSLIIIVFIFRPLRIIDENQPTRSVSRSMLELDNRIDKLQDRIDYLEYEVTRYSNIWAVLTRKEVGIY